jgi:glycosyltransferase domain-containing protein
MIENHTLVIPTYNRPAMLKRLVGFYARRLGRLNMLVLDSSRPEVFQENAAMLASYGDWMQHLQFAGDVPMAVKLHRGLAQVGTRYVSFCADDDVVFPEGLKRAISFLDSHPSHVSAHGRYLNFRVDGNDVEIWIEYAGPGNEAGHPGARIFRLFQKYESLFYGLFRTGDLRDVFAGVASLPTLHYQELFQSAAALIKGKVHRFDAFYAARQSGPAADPARDKWQTSYWFAEQPAEVIEHYRPYCMALWKFYDAYGAEPRLDRVAFLRVLDLAHAVYFATQCSPAYFHSALQAYWPDDHYEEMRSDAALGVARWLRRYPRLLAPARRAARALEFALGSRGRDVRSLNEEVRDRCRAAWRCRIPGELGALGADSAFRSTVLELCGYLDES